jgi:hypothetical protein
MDTVGGIKGASDGAYGKELSVGESDAPNAATDPGIPAAPVIERTGKGTELRQKHGASHAAISDAFHGNPGSISKAALALAKKIAWMPMAINMAFRTYKAQLFLQVERFNRHTVALAHPITPLRWLSFSHLELID